MNKQNSCRCYCCVVTNATCLTKSGRGPRNSLRLRARMLRLSLALALSTSCKRVNVYQRHTIKKYEVVGYRPRHFEPRSSNKNYTSAGASSPNYYTTPLEDFGP
ncbi:hypothetical protein TNCV_2969301 [Trichonephila clavipes]|nr:hypothetical protein TNCV_2969301 [Trichonephila clavipes]